MNFLFSPCRSCSFYFRCRVTVSGFQPILLCFVALAQHFKLFLASDGRWRCVVLVDFDEQPFQLGNPFLGAVKLLPAELDFPGRFHAHLLFHHDAEVILVTQDIAVYHLQMLQHQTFQHLDVG